MSSKWQKSCIEALVTSPLAFKLFKTEQQGVKMMDQYLDRIWPYKYVRQTAQETIEDKELLFTTLPMNCKELFLDIIRVFKLATPECTLEFEPIWVDVYNFHMWKCNEATEYVLHSVKNTNSYFTMTCTNGQYFGSQTFTPKNERFNCLLEMLRALIVQVHSNSDSVAALTKIEFHGTDKEDFEIIRKFVIASLTEIIGKEKRKSTKKKKLKTVYKSINIGIEIEYDGYNCQCLKNDLLTQGAIDFNSGWDGGSTNGDANEQDQCSLRENRLRINGMKGTKALFTLLEWMKINDCKIAANSGMHFHIDCRDAMAKRTMNTNQTTALTSLRTTIGETMRNMPEEIKDIIFNIYNYGSLTSWNSVEGFFINNIKVQPTFETLEWRMGTPTLNYKTLMLQILVAIHLTECAKHKNKNPNEPYLRILGEISNGSHLLPAKTY